MEVDLTKILPGTSFVPFEARAIARPDILWRNPAPELGAGIEAHAYCVPLKGEPADAYGRGAKTYLAERYGGQGLVGNGGGARCGLSNGVQIKGIGRTPVAGRDTDFWYSHGAASLHEGIREAVWGEVCHVGLPYGGVRVHGLISTETGFPSDGRDNCSPGQRALILRQPAIRPAHYMRSVYFRPTKAFSGVHVNDVARTQAAVNRIHAIFEQMLDLTSGSLGQLINDGLTEMISRTARQISTARAKRLMHGALGCSNVCVDGGGWIMGR